MKRSAGFIVVMIVLLLFAWARTEYIRNAFLVADGFAQGTTYHIIVRQPPRQVYFGRRDTVSLKSRIDSILHRFDLSLSTYVPGSVISRVNRNDPDVRVDDLFREVFRVSKEIWEESDGAFDITVGPLVGAWGFGPGAPDENVLFDVDSLLNLVGMDKVHLEGDRVVKEDTAIKLDVNAIAQGYSVDVVMEWLQNQGYHNMLVEIGGEVRARGRKAWGRPWKVGVDKPSDNNVIPGQSLQAIVKLTNKALATSGNYRKFYVKDGVKYAHTIDPHTGYPAKNRLLSVTIVTDKCIYADGYATACMVMGVDKGKSFITSKPGVEAFFIYSGDQGEYLTWQSEGFTQYLVEEE